MAVVFDLLKAIVLQIPNILKAAHKGSVFPLPTVLALLDAGNHVHAMNSSDKAASIKAAVNECLGCQATLRVSYVNPNYHYIGFRKYFDDIWFRYDVDIVKYWC